MIELENFAAGTYESCGDYQCFVPTEINDFWTWRNSEINQKLEIASLKLGELNSLTRLVPNIRLFIGMYRQTEAVYSSRIEGTQTDLIESLQEEELIVPERRDDWREVQNYIAALDESLTMLPTFPISSRLLKHAHKTLMQGVRGEKKQPGKYRTVQNRIGGHSAADARYIPPPPNRVASLMSDLEKFLHNEKIQLPVLIRIAIAHYQFEAIHPFLDGNGRIGRLLIPLYLIEKKRLDKPIFYMSAYLERTRSHYYDNLNGVHQNGGMMQWINYFLDGVEQTAADTVRVLLAVLDLKEELEETIRQTFGRRSDKGMLLLAHLFGSPLVSVRETAKVCDLSYKAAGDLVETMKKAGILKESGTASRNRYYLFFRYTEILNAN